MRFLIICLFSLSTLNGVSQDGHFVFSAGVNTSLGGYDSLNFVIDRYNETRSWLEKEMKNIKALDGEYLSVQYGVGKVFIGFDIALRDKKRFAEGTDATNQLMRRQIKASMNTFGISAGIGVVDDATPLFVGAGVRADFGKFKVKTRVYAVDGDKGNWIKAVDELNASVSIFLRVVISNPGILIEPSYSFGFNAIKPDVVGLNEAINPVTAPADPSSMNSNYNYFGIKVGIAFLGGA
jgi:hypothetical protein